MTDLQVSPREAMTEEAAAAACTMLRDHADAQARLSARLAEEGQRWRDELYEFVRSSPIWKALPPDGPLRPAEEPRAPLWAAELPFGRWTGARERWSMLGRMVCT